MTTLLTYARGLGLNWAWGLLNFTIGCVAGGIWVAVALVIAGVVRQ